MSWLLFIIAGVVMAVLYLRRLFPPTYRPPSSSGGRTRRKRSLPVDSEAQYLLCTFSMAAKIVAADGVVSEEERQQLRSFMRDELELSEKEELLALRIFANAQKDGLELRDYAMAFREYFPDRVQLTDKVIVTLLKLSVSDGYLHPSEGELIRSAALLLGISEPAYELLKAQVV